MNKVKLPSIWPAVCDVWLCGGAIELVIEVMRDNESWWAAAAAAKAEDIMPSTMLAWWPKEAEMGVVALVSLKPSSLIWPWWWPTIAGLKSGWTLKKKSVLLFHKRMSQRNLTFRPRDCESGINSYCVTTTLTSDQKFSTGIFNSSSGLLWCTRGALRF